MNELYVALLKDSLADFAYPALVGGLSYKLSTSYYGLEVRISVMMKSLLNILCSGILQLDISGYNQKIPVLLETIIERMISLTVNPQRFEILKEEVSPIFSNESYCE